LRSQLFRVGEAARHVIGIEDDGGGNDRAGKRPPARFVAAGNRPHPALERGALAAERRPRLFLAKWQARGLFLFARGSITSVFAATHGTDNDHATARTATSNDCAGELRGERRVRCELDNGHQWTVRLRLRSVPEANAVAMELKALGATPEVVSIAVPRTVIALD
jgi:hypothetical protein